MTEAVDAERVASKVATDLYRWLRGKGYDWDELYSGALRGVVEGLPHYRPPGPVAGYAYVCGRRRALHHAGRKKRRRLSFEGFDPDSPSRTPEPAVDLTRGDLERVFGLSRRDAAVVRRMAVEDMTAAEVARKTHRNAKTVQHWVRTAFRRIRSEMTRDEAARRLGVV